MLIFLGVCCVCCRSNLGFFGCKACFFVIFGCACALTSALLLSEQTIAPLYKAKITMRYFGCQVLRVKVFICCLNG
jgi:hypothetical protein